MRVVVQRVSRSKVTINNKVVGQIGNGLTVLLGVGEEDTIEDVNYLADKIVNLRIFHDEQDKMNLSLLDLKYELLVVSQFTLFGDCRKGRRPSFTEAGNPEKANELYQKFVSKCKEYDINVQTGVFQEHMEVEIINDGPVTFILDTQKS